MSGYKRVKIRQWLYVLLTFATLTYVMMGFDIEYVTDNMKMMMTSTLQLFIPSAFSLVPKNPFLHKECYEYKTFNKVRFNCSDASMYKTYSAELVNHCASKLWNISRDRNKVDPWQENLTNLAIGDAESVSKRPSVQLVFLGDSHVRFIFSSLIERIATPRSYYKMGNGTWQTVYEFLKRKQRNLDLNIDVIHLDIPLKITFKWDPLLESLPNLIHKWLSGKEDPPTHLVFNSCLHFMLANGPQYYSLGFEKASEYYYEHLRPIATLVAELAETISVTFKMQDQLLGVLPRHTYTHPNVALYNKIALNTLSGKKFSFWDSTMPLAELYNKECKINRQITPDKNWTCGDLINIGYVTVNEYVNMFLNEVCNSVM